MIFHSRLRELQMRCVGSAQCAFKKQLLVDHTMLNERPKNSKTGLIERCELSVVSVGTFGRAVARHLRSYQPDLRESNVTSPLTDVSPAILKGSGGDSTVVVVAAHTAPAVCELFARVAHENRLPFLPVVVDESTLRLGPVVVPGVGGCWRCWVARYRQHDAHIREREALHAFYNEHPDNGPRGYLEPFAWIIASQLAAVLRSKQDLEYWAGWLWQVDLFSREVSTGELIGVDGCSWCGLNRSLPGRTYGDMQRALAWLWNGNGNRNGNDDAADEWKGREVKVQSACEGERK